MGMPEITRGLAEQVARQHPETRAPGMPPSAELSALRAENEKFRAWLGKLRDKKPGL